MKYNINLTSNQNGFENLSGILGDENEIGNDDLGYIQRMIDSIENYYRDVFELEEYASRKNVVDVDICVDYHLGSTMVYDSLEDVENGFDDEEKKYIVTRIVQCLLEDTVDNLLSSDKEIVKEDYVAYLNKIDEQLKKTSLNDSLKEFADSLYDDIKNDSSNDRFGEYSDGTVEIFYPRVCLQAKIYSILKGKNEKEYKWGLFEKVLAHELYHFFQESCCSVAGTNTDEDNIYFSNMEECLAEYFCGMYMESGRRVSENDYKYEWLVDPNEFQPGDPESDGGYSGSTILRGMISVQSDEEKARIKDNEIYVDIFRKSLLTITSEEACDILIQFRDDEY